MIEKWYSVCSFGGRICLGKAGEGRAVQLRIDVSDWIGAYPDAQVKLFVTPPKPLMSYFAPLTGPIDGEVVWTVEKSDTQQAGSGTLELLMMQGETVLVKSQTAHTVIEPSPSAQGSAGDAPETHPAWWEEALDKIGEAEKESLAAISTAKTSALSSVETAKGAAVGAVEGAFDEEVAAGLDAIAAAGNAKVEQIEKERDEQLASITAAGAVQQAAIEAKGKATLETIPEDYAKIDADVKSLKDTMSDVQIYPKVFDSRQDSITMLTGYNLDIDGKYHPVSYTAYCMDQDSFFKIADGADTVGISGSKGLFIRFYDERMNPLGNGGQSTATNYTVNVRAADNPNLAADAKWVKFGGSSEDLSGVNFSNLIGGKFVLASDWVQKANSQFEGVYRTIGLSDMQTGYVVQSNGTKANNENYASIEGIPVVPNQKIEMTAYFGGGATSSGGISGWDVHGNFKQRVFDGPINGNPTTARMQYDSKEIIIPDGVYYIAFSSHTGGTLPIALRLYEVHDSVALVDHAVKKHEALSTESGRVFDDEIKDTVESAQKVLAASGKQMLTMAVFTDLHNDPKYAINPLSDMFANIEALNNRLHFDALMNLGDSIDGQFQTQYDAESCLAEVVKRMYDITPKSHSLTGNHDDNVQSTWADQGGLAATERLTLLELNEILFKGSAKEIHNPNHITDYYVDFDQYNIRVICIGVNYTSFVKATQTWLESVALDTDKSVLVFSHCATKPEWGYMNDISNGSYVEEPLNNFAANGGTVIALIHGHSHGDMIESDPSIRFTEVAIGCAKFETPSGGTSGVTYQPRNADDYTKILFDVVCVDQTNRKVHFIRCGAGADRVISY